VARALVSGILTRTIEGLDLEFPELTLEQETALAKAKKLLESK